MKRFLRYLLLITCVAVLNEWGLSYWKSYWISFGYRSIWNPGFGNGYIIVVHVFDPSGRPSLFDYGSNTSVSSLGKEPVPRFLGFYYIVQNQPHVIFMYIPFWMVFAPLLLLTLIFWRRPLREWWRGNVRKGFEVEIKNNPKENDAGATKGQSKNSA